LWRFGIEVGAISPQVEAKSEIIAVGDAAAAIRLHGWRYARETGAEYSWER